MRQILLYGLILGASLFLLQFAQYRLVFIRHAESMYTGIVAIMCCVAGIWAGIAITKKWHRHQELKMPTPSKAFTAPETMHTLLHITPREKEVLVLMAEGLSNQEIAERLFLSLNTVKTHAANVFSKLDVQRRTQAIHRAKVLGILPE